MTKQPIDVMLDAVEWKPVDREGLPAVDGDIPYATHHGTLKIGECELECVVLNTGERLFTEESIERFFGILNAADKEG